MYHESDDLAPARRILWGMVAGVAMWGLVAWGIWALIN